MRITDRERAVLANLFKGNDELLRLMRKMFLPEIDPTAPIGQIIDLWMTVDVKDQTPEEALINIKARNQLIAHVDQVLMQMNLIANLELEKPEDALKKALKDSNK